MGSLAGWLAGQGLSSSGDVLVQAKTNEQHNTVGLASVHRLLKKMFSILGACEKRDVSTLG